jgi:hypothetical protein
MDVVDQPIVPAQRRGGRVVGAWDDLWVDLRRRLHLPNRLAPGSVLAVFGAAAVNHANLHGLRPS